MPLVTATNQDPITQLIQFKTSLVFEMLLSAQAAAHEWRKRVWSEEVASVLGDDFILELRRIYKDFHLGCDFTEIAIDYPDHQDVRGFINHVRKLDHRRFVFYVLGRVYRMEELPEKPTKDSLLAMVDRFGGRGNCNAEAALFDWADDIDGLKSRVTAMWSVFWEDFLKSKAIFESNWIQGIREKEDVLFGQGGVGLLKDITGKKYDSLPEPIPPEIPVTQVVCVPIVTMYRPFLMFYGYGNVTLLYECVKEAAAGNERGLQVQELLKTFRALSDENRLSMLKLIAGEEKCCNGKLLAEKLGISPSVVSRHLAQLKDAGIIAEQPLDNRALSYSVNRERLGRLSEYLLEHIKPSYE